MEITLRIERFDPDLDRKPYFAEFQLELEPTARVLDALHEVKNNLDPSLAFRRSCGHGICGSDAMRINGVNRLACRQLIRDHEPLITVQPLEGFTVVKDLVVDMEAFFAKHRSVYPYLIAGPPPPHERRQRPSEAARFADTSRCILCAACTTSCPIYWSNSDYVGPAAIVNAHRFIFDSRDEGARLRLNKLDAADGVWRCRTIFNCTNACPRSIEVTRAIQEVKRALLYNERVPGSYNEEP